MKGTNARGGALYREVVIEEDGEGGGEGALQGVRGVEGEQQREHVVVEEVRAREDDDDDDDDASVEAGEVPVLRRGARQGEPPLVSQGLRDKPRHMRPPRRLHPARQLHLPGHRGRRGRAAEEHHVARRHDARHGERQAERHGLVEAGEKIDLSLISHFSSSLRFYHSPSFNICRA